MVIRILFTSIFLSLLFLCSGAAQVTIDDLLPLVERTGEESTPELVAWLEDLLREPLDLRTAGLDELAELPGISPQTAGALYRALSDGEVATLEDLTKLIGADPDLFRLLQLVTYLEPKEQADRLRMELRTRVEVDMQRRRGFRDTLRRIIGDDTIDLGRSYIAPPGSMTTRLLGRVDRWGFGVIIDRDPGEPLLYHDTLGFSYRTDERLEEDFLPGGEMRHGTGLFLSGHLTRSFGPIDLILGDYSLQIAHGLLFGRSFGGRKGGTPTRDPFGGSSRVRPWRSRTESGYFRGLALALPNDTLIGLRVGGLAFLSQRYLDGSVASVDPEGLLATRRDIRRDDQVRERLAGGRAEVTIGDGTIGGTVTMLSRRARHEQSEGALPDTGTEVRLASLDVRWHAGDLTGSGEVGLSNGIPAITVATGFGRGRLDATLAVRAIAPGFTSPYGVTFAESPTSSGGEIGLYLGTRFRAARHIGCEAFLDLFSRHNPDPRLPVRLHGEEGMLRLTWRPLSRTRVEGTLRVKREDESQIGSDDDRREILRIAPRRRTLARLLLRRSIEEEHLFLRLRIERRTEESEGEEPRSGAVVYIDGGWSPTDDLRLLGGLGLFSGGSDPIAVYAHEYSLPGGMSLPSLSGRGGRSYLTILWNVSKRLSLGGRFEQTSYTDREEISPGSLRAIDGDHSSSLSFQADWHLGAFD